VVVEWADRVPGALPGERLEITLAHDARRPSWRHLLLVGTGERHAALVAKLRPKARAKSRPGSRSR
jgi:tRNA threonylcarbamoyladenosine biosynthesis protein TsaE